MDFSEKLTALISLTGIKSVTLANAVNIDTAQISRLKTGVREMPQNQRLLYDMAECLAGYLDNDYKLSGIYELTHDVRLQSHYNQQTLIDIVYKWMSTPDTLKENHSVNRFLKSYNDFTIEAQELTVAELPENIKDTDAQKVLFFYGSSGKRAACREFRKYMLSIEEPFSLRVFTDEADDWITEDASYAEELKQTISTISQRDCRIQRINPPTRNAESTFKDIERWLPTYMTGTVKMFLYPYVRDEMHRRTLYIIPGHIALFSSSLYGAPEAQMTQVTQCPDAVKSLNTYYDSILSNCRTMMTAYTINEKNHIIDCVEAIAQTYDNGIYKSNFLSAHTLPAAAYDTILPRANPSIRKLLTCYAHNERFRADILRDYVITDIMCLPDINNVLAGKEPIPATLSSVDSLFYTREEYRLHLEHILWYLLSFPNYHVVLLDSHELQNLTIYIKGDNHALVIKESQPRTVFKVTERELATALQTYLKTLVKTRLTMQPREEVINTLLDEIAALL